MDVVNVRDVVGVGDAMDVVGVINVESVIDVGDVMDVVSVVNVVIMKGHEKNCVMK